jgi:hypothetical protein
MGSYKHPRIFLPLDLQIVEMVYDAARTHIVNNDPFRDTTRDEERKEGLARRSSLWLRAPWISTPCSTRS